MNIDISVVPATDLERFLHTDKITWFDAPGSDPVEKQLRGVPADQRFVAEVPDGPRDAYAGIYGVRPMRLAVPGGPRVIPAAGLTWVGVHPDLRRRGVLTAMLRDHFTRSRDAGLAVSALLASEAAIYGRHGYGHASSARSATLGRGTTLTAPHLDESAARIRTEFATSSDAGMAARVKGVDEYLTTQQVGAIIFEDDFYEMIVRDRPEELLEKEPMRLLFAVEDGHDVGAAAFRREHKWERGVPGGSLEVFFLGGSVPARLALLRRLLDFDLMAAVKLRGLAPDDPLWWWIGPREGTDGFTADNVWVRILDLPAAVAARGYEGSCDVVVDVVDEPVPQNAGRWRLTVAGGEGRAERTEAPADLQLPVAVLGSAYLGGANLIAAHRAGVLAEERPGALAEVDRAFRTTFLPTPSPGF